MRQSSYGWSPQDLEKVYRYYGFVVREGGKHRIYTHPEAPNLIATVKRGKRLAVGYIKDAITLIDKLMILKEGGET